MAESPYGTILDELGIATSPETKTQRAALQDLLGRLAGLPGVAGVFLYGSLARGGGDAHSDLDLTVEAAPGRWAELWERRCELATVSAGSPVLGLEHQWGAVTDEACYAALTPEGSYIDLVIRRAGAPGKAGEVALWRATAGGMAGGGGDAEGNGAPEPLPAVAATQAEDALGMFWMGSLLCARYIVRGDVWGALEFIGSLRNLFLRLWRMARNPAALDRGWAKVDAELPADVRQRLGAAVPQLERRQLAAALWEIVALGQDAGPELAAELGCPYPHSGATVVMRVMQELFAGAGLRAEPPGAAALPPVGHDSVVSLRPVTTENLRAVCRLEVAPDQRHVVAPNAVSLAEAAFHGETAWHRAIYADETPVGFAMLWQDRPKHEYFLWRFMIDAQYQRLGYGRQVLAMVIDHVRTDPEARELGVSYDKGPGSPEGFYRRFGFVETGEIYDTEYEARLELSGRG